MELASRNQDDPMTLLTCASMLLTIGDDKDFQAIIPVIMSHVPEEDDAKYQVVQGLISLGCLKDAGKILADMPASDKVHRARAAVFHGTNRYEDALAALGAMSELTEPDRVLKVQVLGSMGKHDKAIALAQEILSELYDTLGLTIAMGCCMVDPELVVIGGGMSKAGRALLEGVMPRFEHHMFHACKGTRFALATLGNDAGIYGCFHLALQAGK